MPLMKEPRKLVNALRTREVAFGFPGMRAHSVNAEVEGRAQHQSRTGPPVLIVIASSAGGVIALADLFTAYRLIYRLPSFSILTRPGKAECRRFLAGTRQCG